MVLTRLVSAVVAMAVAGALTFAVTPAAHAAPKDNKPSALEIKGKGIEKPIVVRQTDEPRLFEKLFIEVDWLASARPQTSAPKSGKLGDKYTVTVLVKDAPSLVYDLYPLAAGGPRAYRPAKQPSGKKTAGWFYGRLSMSESLRLSGAPLEAKPDVVHGGIGGGIGEDLGASEVNPVESMSEVFGEVRRLFLLNGAVLLVILVGLAGMAFLIRRRI
ncbi:hypothetical protein [Actinoplanes sp. DH11]|uniref:hypothetical protein n=1 Tax=Actinoplanes sp. DH11 TaxID=2857011 RepID=UPI001E491A49|nr:hypothetical protein [Actinoplanes sp. DH11]